ncbi:MULTISPECIES: NUDIX hydrolase [Pseudomonas]|uniref:NUDIX hydrolase n=1 Tax=Pseudomonas TaxID=286 RepID=UPI00069DEFE7|nr:MULTISPECIES: NUDIX domain-containing protein [Pseudomonas]MCE0463077.1 NUDIX domain-containing protein [Pseudomonas uvaldensis]
MFPVSIKGVLQSPEGLIVLMLNERDEWELPGGRIEVGETAPQCLAREIVEELAVEVSVGEPLDSYLFEVIPGKHVFISTYRCQLLGGFVPTISHEHKEIGLFEPGRLPANLPEGYRQSVAKALGG